MDVIGIEATQIQDLGEEGGVGLEGLAFCPFLRTPPPPGRLPRLAGTQAQLMTTWLRGGPGLAKGNSVGRAANSTLAGPQGLSHHHQG